VKIDRAIADRAAAGQRHRRLAAACHQRSEHQDRGAHLAHDVVRRLARGELAGTDRHHAAEILRPATLDAGRGAKLVEQVPETVDIGEARQVAQRQRLVGQQRAGHQGECGVLGAGDRQATGKAVTAANENSVHAGALSHAFRHASARRALAQIVS
jgi:hypothetical protein